MFKKAPEAEFREHERKLDNLHNDLNRVRHICAHFQSDDDAAFARQKAFFSSHIGQLKQTRRRTAAHSTLLCSKQAPAKAGAKDQYSSGNITVITRQVFALSAGSSDRYVSVLS